jgi:hypothetical protein
MSPSTNRRPAARRALASLALLVAGAAACAAPTAPTDRALTTGAGGVLLDAAPRDTTPQRDSTGVGINSGGHVNPNI